jgi:hypothetical protein
LIEPNRTDEQKECIMLVLRRSEGQWVEMTHRSGDRIRFRVYDLVNQGVGRVHLAFDDPSRTFEIIRPERRQAAPAAPAPTDTTVLVAAPEALEAAVPAVNPAPADPGVELMLPGPTTDAAGAFLHPQGVPSPT